MGRPCRLLLDVLADGRIVKSGGPELALELEAHGYDFLKDRVVREAARCAPRSAGRGPARRPARRPQRSLEVHLAAPAGAPRVRGGAAAGPGAGRHAAGGHPGAAAGVRQRSPRCRAERCAGAAGRRAAAAAVGRTGGRRGCGACPRPPLRAQRRDLRPPQRRPGR
ncbi:hypothetical protein G6F31_017725 [Rhizopus arrhizus]|nr:hypothetical protein G6F31_017725 [Rhizopus arrhizus]